jgi:flavin-dependent dehydrogenase
MKEYDVIVIGAGLAGLQCARLLGNHGLSVLLADRKPSLDQAIHTTGIFVRRTLEDFSLPPDCLGPIVRHVSLYSPARRRLNLESPHDEFRVGRMGHLYRRMLEDCLDANVEWRPATRYVGLSEISNGVEVTLEAGGTTRTVKTRFLIGADGANSRVARDLNLDRNHEFIVGVEEVYEGVPLDGPPRLHCFLDPHVAPGYLAWVVNDGEQVHVGVGGYAADFDPTASLNQFRGSVKNACDLSSGRLVDRRGGRIPVGGILKRIANERGLLLGDAAGAVSPLTAGGLDPCMRLSTLAAKVTNDYLQTGKTETLATYSGELFRSRFISRLWMRRLIAGIRRPLAIELACATMRLPLINNFAWHIFFGRGSFPDVQADAARQPANEVMA